ncbi:hypothetical protein D3C83_215650 [compost metagenome]
MHATGGKDIRRPGEGIQRERFINLATFRGPLRRILRHAGLAPVAKKEAAPSKAVPKPRLRPVARQDEGN